MADRTASPGFGGAISDAIGAVKDYMRATAAERGVSGNANEQSQLNSEDGSYAGIANKKSDPSDSAQ